MHSLGAPCPQDRISAQTQKIHLPIPPARDEFQSTILVIISLKPHKKKTGIKKQKPPGSESKEAQEPR